MRVLRHISLGCLLLLTVVAGVGQAASSPRSQMQQTVNGILEVIRAPENEYSLADKEAAILALVEDRFDFGEMSRRTLAAGWKKISDQERARFQKLFTELLEKTYIRKVKQYSGQDVRFGDQRIRRNKAVVESFVVKDRIETPLIYRLRSEGAKWLVYDVIIEGVSLVSNYRSQFRTLLDREKISGLLLRLEEKVAALNAEEG